MADAEIDRLYVMWLCHDLLPFRTGESKYFKKFISALKLDNVIPSRINIAYSSNTRQILFFVTIYSYLIEKHG